MQGCPPIYDFKEKDSCEPLNVGIAPFTGSAFVEYLAFGKFFKKPIELVQGEPIILDFGLAQMVNFQITDVCLQKDTVHYYNAMPCEVHCSEIETGYIAQETGVYKLIYDNLITEFGAIAGQELKLPNIFNFTKCKEFRVVDPSGLDVDLGDARQVIQSGEFCNFTVNFIRTNNIPCIIDLCKFECLPSKTINVCTYKCTPNFINPV